MAWVGQERPTDVGLSTLGESCPNETEPKMGRSNRKINRQWSMVKSEIAEKVKAGKFPITFQQYIIDRSQRRSGLGLTMAEAVLLGIDYPLPRGWPEKQMMIDEATYRALVAARRRAYAKAADRRATPKVEKEDATFVASSRFLESYEWRRLRLTILKRDGMKCACCGATPETGAVMHVDHIKPRKFFPALAMDPNNLQVLCHECNHGKGNWDTTDFRMPA